MKMLTEYVLTGSISVDAKLLEELGCDAAEADQLLAAEKVRELMNHYWITDELTLGNAQRLLAEWRARNDLA
ncbi:hypothetical protein ACS5PN_11380 [Roseateles sp. NT4]|uniref:hypothetical protein n=1 Tax=Roseateles sp. NT4 TaxID=3453715 RepID=UPI003EE96E29